MSKPIKLTEKYLNECREEFEKALTLTKLADGKLSFTKVFSDEDRKATIYFTPLAWAKMAMLIQEFDKEVAWHGVARRSEDESVDAYIIEDIVVYPQAVSGASVEMDTEEYARWLEENDDDERFYNIHMQGHSHVNMGTSPSSVDLNHQEEILEMLKGDSFYIFMIWNKSFKSTNKIYDMKKNILFEDKDITIKLDGVGENLDEFLASAKEMVRTKTYTNPQTNFTGFTYNSVPIPVKTDEKKGKKKSNKKQKASERPTAKIGAGWMGKDSYCNAYQGVYDDLEDEDEDYFYGNYYNWGGK